MTGDRNHEATSELMERVRSVLEREPDVVVAYLFGSRARGTSGRLSDVDIALLLREVVEEGRRHLDLLDALAQAVPEGPEVVILNNAPIALGYRVLRDGQLIMSRDERARIAHWVRTVDRYIDMEPMRRLLDDGLKHRIDEGRFGRP